MVSLLVLVFIFYAGSITADPGPVTGRNLKSRTLNLTLIIKEERSANVYTLYQTLECL